MTLEFPPLAGARASHIVRCSSQKRLRRRREGPAAHAPWKKKFMRRIASSPSFGDTTCASSFKSRLSARPPCRLKRFIADSQIIDTLTVIRQASIQEGTIVTLIYGHRGAKGEAPENTLTSFRRCLERGVRRCELDLHLSQDGELMVIHDPTLKRTTGRRGKVSEHDAQELMTYDARLGGPGWVQPCPIPRLAELFEKCDFEHWQLEVKSASRVRAERMVLAIRELAERYELLRKITVTSSSRTVLRALERLTPDLSRGLVAEYAWLDPLKVAKNYGCDLLALNWTLCTPERLLKAQQQGLHVSVWTVNEPALMRRLADFGVDSLITDFPGLAIATLGKG